MRGPDGTWEQEQDISDSLLSRRVSSVEAKMGKPKGKPRDRKGKC